MLTQGSLGAAARPPQSLPVKILCIRSVLLRQHELVDNLPECFRKLIGQGDVPLDMLQVLFRMASDPLLSDTTDTYPKVPSIMLPRDSEYILDGYSSMTISDTIKQPSFEKLLFNALLRYYMNAANSTLFNVTNFGRRMELTHKLPNIDCSQLTTDQLDCLVWMWLVGIESWRAWGAIAPRGWVLLGQLLHQCPRVTQSSVDDLDKLCYKFFWTQDFSIRARSFWKVGFERE